MEQLLQVFIFFPLAGFLVSLPFSNKQEKWISAVTYVTVGLQLICFASFVAYWLCLGASTLDLKHFVFYKEDNVEIYVSLYFDRISAVFGLLGAFITLLIVIFSRFYLHRDEGFKRFFSTVLLFFFGYNTAILSGNFETLFIGWEFLGITSFLLISFYRDRYLPAKNALKTISMYRFGDICLILVMWNGHHLWHENITFSKLSDLALVTTHIQANFYPALFVMLMLIVSASVKSAQFPFSSWLPRSMEGPTTSSAIFYGSLSVHLGVFLLLRTYPYWASVLAAKIFVIVIGTLTAVIATLIAKVQSTVKTQIAYASIAQIGLIFIEVALGWHELALVHISGNAFLRTYQLLVSPSVLGYLVHDQVFNPVPKPRVRQKTLLNKLQTTLYVLSVKEWNMDIFLKTVLWNPFKFLGKKFYYFSGKVSLIILILFFAAGLLLFYFDNHIPKKLDDALHSIFGFVSMALVLMAFVEKQNALKAWMLIIISQFYCVLSVAMLNDKYQYDEIMYYAGGLASSAIVGGFVLRRLLSLEKAISLNDFYGHVYEHPKLAFAFLMACLAFVSLPFTPSFIGIDLIFTHIDHEEYLLITFTTINFLVLEVAVLRIYARLFWGPHMKHTHPIAYRSS